MVPVLRRLGYRVICHDRSFADPAQRASYGEREDLLPIAAQSPEDIVAELKGMGPVSRFVLNDAQPNVPKNFEDIEVEELQAAYTALLGFPFRLCQLLLPGMKREKGGAIVFITSARAGIRGCDQRPHWDHGPGPGGCPGSRAIRHTGERDPAQLPVQ